MAKLKPVRWQQKEKKQQRPKHHISIDKLRAIRSAELIRSIRHAHILFARQTFEKFEIRLDSYI